jgi:hypothetical protein
MVDWMKATIQKFVSNVNKKVFILHKMRGSPDAPARQRKGSLPAGMLYQELSKDVRKTGIAGKAAPGAENGTTLDGFAP